MKKIKYSLFIFILLFLFLCYSLAEDYIESEIIEEDPIALEGIIVGEDNTEEQEQETNVSHYLIEKECILPDEGYIIIARYWSDSGIPPDATLIATTITDEAIYNECYNCAQNLIEELDEMILIDISLLDNGINYITDEVEIEITISTDITIEIINFSNSSPVVENVTQTDTSIIF